MRIGVVTSSYPQHEGDAAGNFVAAHVDALYKLGHEVEVVVADNPSQSGMPDELEKRGWRAAIDGALATAQLTAEVMRIGRDWDMIIAHWLPCAIAALPLARPTVRGIEGAPPGRPLLAIAHGGDVHTLRRLRLLKPTLQALRMRGAKLAFVTEELRALAEAPDALVQPMGIDVDHFAALGRVPTTLPTIAVIARLVPIKGVDVMVEAFARLESPADLLIAGEGPERERLVNRAYELAETHSTAPARFLGAVDAPDRDQLLREASVVVIPSRVLDNGRSEGMPLVALEALAAGVPVVASKVGGLVELAARAAPGAITLVPPEDPDALAEAIDRVLASSPTPAMLRASVAPFSWPRVAQRFLDYCEAGDTRRHESA